jgi:two-component system, NarL family, invasion response regulator UvrY
MIRVAIADDHELIREGLKKLLLGASDIAVAAEAATLDGTLTLLRDGGIDVLVLDLSLAGGADLESLRIVRAQFPAVAVLVLSVHPEQRCAVQALRAGAAGYVSKAVASDQVVMAIRKIGAGGRYISPLVAELLADEVSRPAARPPHMHLTPREQEVFLLLGSGMPIKRVALELNLSVSSVNTYRARIFRKMGLHTNAALIRYAVEHGLVG